MLGMDETEDDRELEAELLALTGEAGTTSRKSALKGQGEFLSLGLAQYWGQIDTGL